MRASGLIRGAVERFGVRLPLRSAGRRLTRSYLFCRPWIEKLENRLAPAALSLVSNWNGPIHGYDDVWGEGNFAYVGHGNGGGVDIVDISNPSNPTLAANFKGSGDNQIWSVKVLNNLGFFSSGFFTTNLPNGVYVVDLHDPYHPVQLALITQAQGGLPKIHGVAADGNYLYECNNTSTIAVFDVSNPSNPVFVRDLTSPSGYAVTEVTPQNGRLYATVTNGGGFVDVFDVSNVATSAPLLSEFKTGPASHTAWPTADGHYMAVSHEIQGGTVTIWDIHDLSHPAQIASLPAQPTSVAFSPQFVMISGQLVYAAWYEAGVQVYDISLPTSPVLVGNYKTYSGTATGPNVGCWEVYPFLGTDRILASDTVGGLFVLSLPAVSVQGQVYLDGNGNGKLDPGEMGIAGRTVYLDTNGNGVLDPQELRTTTDANGNYSFSNLPPGAYRVREVLPAGWSQTTVNPSPVTPPGATGVNFGNIRLATIAGRVFSDANGNGVQDPNEPGLAGATVFLDANNNGVLDSGEVATLTNSTGYYNFSVAPGTYTVRAVIPAGATQTTPNPASVSVSTGAVVTGIRFGIQQSTIAGTVFQDQNANGVQDPGEPGLPGRTVFLDLNQNGAVGTYTATLNSPDTPQAIPDLGAISSTVHSSGFVGTITAVSVTLNITHTYDADLRITLITPWNRAIQLVFHRGGSGQNFTNTILSDQAAAPIGAGTAPFNGTYRPEQPLAWVNGGSADGDWVLQVADTGPGNTGTLDGWSITFSTSEPTAQTDANGKYLLTGLPPGKYIVREVVPPGQVQTTADPPVLNVSAGQTISNVNFGTYQPSAVRSHLTQAAGATSDHSGDQRLSPSASSIFVTGPNRSPTLQNHLAAKKREHSLDETFSDRALDIFFASVELRIDELVTLGGTAR